MSLAIRLHVHLVVSDKDAIIRLATWGYLHHMHHMLAGIKTIFDNTLAMRLASDFLAFYISIFFKLE